MGRGRGGRKGRALPRDSPIVHRLGEPAKDGVPVGQVGFLLGHVLLTVAQHLREQTHKPICLLLQHSGAEGAQVQEVACKERRLRAQGPDRHASSPHGLRSAWRSGNHVSVQEEFHGEGHLSGLGLQAVQGRDLGQPGFPSWLCPRPGVTLTPPLPSCFLVCKTGITIPTFDVKAVWTNM